MNVLKVLKKKSLGDVLIKAIINNATSFYSNMAKDGFTKSLKCI